MNELNKLTARFMGRNKGFTPNSLQLKNIENSANRTINFISSDEYKRLKEIATEKFRNNSIIHSEISNNHCGCEVIMAGYKVWVDIYPKSNNSQAYNVDKLLEFLSEDNTVYLILSVDHKVYKIFTPFDISVISKMEIKSSRGSRGIAYFPRELFDMVSGDEYDTNITTDISKIFINTLIK